LTTDPDFCLLPCMTLMHVRYIGSPVRVVDQFGIELWKTCCHRHGRTPDDYQIIMRGSVSCPTDQCVPIRFPVPHTSAWSHLVMGTFGSRAHRNPVRPAALCARTRVRDLFRIYKGGWVFKGFGVPPHKSDTSRQSGRRPRRVPWVPSGHRISMT
jgi:hypothetical protein